MFFEKRSWKFWNNTIGTIALVILIIYLTIYEVNNSKDLKVYGKYAIGEIVELSYYKGTRAVVEFKVNNTIYESNFGVSWGLTYIGEKYIVKYSSKNPGNNRTLVEKPVFTKDQKTNITNGSVTNFVILPDGIGFEYKVNGKEYHKKVHASDSLIEKVKINDEYEVEYLIDNPKIAIMKFDKPWTAIKQLNWSIHRKI